MSENTYQKFEGPIETLLSLIENRSLEITQVSLSEVTDAFLAKVRALEAAEPQMLADFIAVASRLILIKSKALLPELALTDEEERDIKDLEERVALYAKLKVAIKEFNRTWKDAKPLGSREYLKGISSVPVFYPGPDFTLPTMTHSLQGLLADLQKLVHEEVSVTATMVSLEKKIEEVVLRMNSLKETTLKKLGKEGSRAELVVLFLAVLHLAREQRVVIEQQSHFSDIMITTNA